MSVVIVGRGRVGRALCAALRAARVKARLERGRGSGRGRGRGKSIVVAAGDVLILAVPDARIASTAARVSPAVDRTNVVLHCAGALGVDALGPCATRGAATGAMHPLVSFASARRAPPLAGTTWMVSGDARAVRAARTLGRACGARAVRADVHGAAYHATAAMLANGAAALAHEAVRSLVALGVGRRAAERAAAALVRSVAHNVDTVGVPRALTGPIVRGDAGTVARHRAALAALDHRTLRSYDAIAPVVLGAARDAGLRNDAAAGVMRALRSRPGGSPRRRRRP